MSDPYAFDAWTAFVRGIAAKPDDDVPRLVAADWLDDHDPARAEFIRVGHELATKPGHNHGGTAVSHHENLGDYVGCPNCDLTRRKRELLAENEHRWLAGLPICPPVPGELKDPEYAYGFGYWLVKNHATWKRGFVAGVRIDWPGWRDFGDAILDRHPVEVVTVTGWPRLNFGPIAYLDYSDPKARTYTREARWEVTGDLKDPLAYGNRVVWSDRDLRSEGRVGHHVRLEHFDRENAAARTVPGFLRRRWPADPDRPRIKFELPAAQDRMYRNDQYGDVQYADVSRDNFSRWTMTQAVRNLLGDAALLAELRRRVEQDALRDHPRDTLRWESEPGAPRELPWRPLPLGYSIAHRCPADADSEARWRLWDQDPTPDDPFLMSVGRYATVDLTLRPYQFNGTRPIQTHYFYTGRCAGCSTTFLLEARESTTPTGGTR